MAVLAECPQCHRIQSLKNKKCARCEGDLTKPKKAGKVPYWIAYRLPGGKQRRELIGKSIEEAKDADGKRRVQKREKRIFEILPEATMTFRQLSKWYLDTRRDEGLRSFVHIEGDLNNFCAVYGDKVVADIKLEDIEKYQTIRRRQGRAPATVDQELTNVKTMMRRAEDNDLIGSHVLKPFRRVKRLLKKGANVRTRTITVEEYQGLLQVAPVHLKALLIVGFNTGMRLGEIRGLRWPMIDRAKGFIRLAGDTTKEGRPKSIPINHHVQAVLDRQPRAIGHDFVFIYRGAPFSSTGAVCQSLKTACNTVGITYGFRKADGATFHSIRKSVKTLMVEAGVDQAYRDTILGHSLKGMDAHYIMPSDEALRAAMDRYTAFVDGRTEEQKKKVAGKS